MLIRSTRIVGHTVAVIAVTTVGEILYFLILVLTFTKKCYIITMSSARKRIFDPMRF